MQLLTQQEKTALNELQSTKYQGKPLIELVEKNITDRVQTNEQVSGSLYNLYIDGKINISATSINPNVRYDRLIVAHYEIKHKERK